MSSYDEFYCQIYIDVEFDKHAYGEVRDFVADLTGGEKLPDGGCLTDFCLINVDYNDNYNDKYSRWRKMFRGNFLYFKFYLEIDPLPELPLDEYIAGIKKLLARLKAAGVRAVPVCDFEDELGVSWRDV
ncbi:MAG: hypothetical protein FWD98_03310 [Defluviitaleaceae bacterium]|nr:hypothetical protein [Defluviitaleaceae bacterium]